MKTAKVNPKGQVTIPAAIRKAANLQAGDPLVFEVRGNHLVVKKAFGPEEIAHLEAVTAVCAAEWLSPEDEEAWSVYNSL